MIEILSFLGCIYVISILTFVIVHSVRSSDRRVDKMLDRIMARDLMQYTETAMAMRPDEVELPRPRPVRLTQDEKQFNAAREQLLSNVPSSLHGQALEYIEDMVRQGRSPEHINVEEILEEKTLEDIENA